MPEWVLAVILAAIGSVGLWEFLKAWHEQRTRRKVTEAEALKTGAEARSILADASAKTLDGAFDLIGHLNDQMGELNSRVDKQDRKIGGLQRALQAYAERVAYLMNGISILMRQITEAKQAPCWKPDEWTPPDTREGRET